jgi:hypothetical protein
LGRAGDGLLLIARVHAGLVSDVAPSSCRRPDGRTDAPSHPSSRRARRAHRTTRFPPTRATRATIFNPSARRSARPIVGPSTGDVPATGLGRRREQP